MKQIVCGKDKGYLIPLSEFEDKIKKRIPLLKDKAINVYINRWVGAHTSRIIFSEPDEKIDDGIFLDKSGFQSAESIFVQTKILTDALGIEDSVAEMELKIKLPDGKFQHAGFHDALTDKDNLFYFMIIKEPETVWIKEE